MDESAQHSTMHHNHSVYPEKEVSLSSARAYPPLQVRENEPQSYAPRQSAPAPEYPRVTKFKFDCVSRTIRMSWTSRRS